MENKDGGAAFPTETAYSYIHGMSFRDYLAAHAPEVPDWYLESFHERERYKAKENDTYQMRGALDAVVVWRFEYADAMLKAREQ